MIRREQKKRRKFRVIRKSTGKETLELRIKMKKIKKEMEEIMGSEHNAALEEAWEMQCLTGNKELSSLVNKMVHFDRESHTKASELMQRASLRESDVNNFCKEFEDGHNKLMDQIEKARREVEKKRE